MSDTPEPHQLLEWARDLGRTVSFLDFHVHPFDVLSGDITYRRNGKFDGVFSRAGAIYHAPAMDDMLEINEVRADSIPDSARAFLLASRLKYMHTGSKVFADQLEATGLSGALLLPVVRAPGRAAEMLETTTSMFSGDRRMIAGCAFPVGMPAKDLSAFFSSARENYGIRAIKIHPNLSGIDPLTQYGHDSIEATLEAAGALGLPIVVHGGYTSVLRPSKQVEYGSLSHLETINWSLSSVPVVIAHAGCYELTSDEIRTALSKLKGMFDRHPNLMADTSSLSLASLRLVLQKVSHDRLVFGSDALYVSIRKAWLGFLRALREVSPAPDIDLLRIASINPMNCLGPHLSYAPIS